MLKSLFGDKRDSQRRIYAIGDVHGCANELEQLLRKLEIDSDTLVIFLGDYIDRGLDSRRVIDLALELKTKCEVIALMGNHEAMFLDFLERPESIGSGLFILNGGSSTLANYSSPNVGSFDIPQTHIEFLKSLRLFYETDTHFFVHAGVPLKRPLASLDPVTDRETFLWTRGPFLTTTEDFGKIIVHGHTPNEEPERRANRINVDTGCVFGGSLTAYDVARDKFISVPKAPSRVAIPPTLQREASGVRVAVRFNGRMPIHASRPGETPRPFETMNYNQFGLLLCETPETHRIPPSISPHFALGDQIEGVIGTDPRYAVRFQGHVVRSEARLGMVVFGVKIDRIAADGDANGNEGWISRPA